MDLDMPDWTEMHPFLIAFASVALTLAALLTVSTLMRLADAERRIESCERSIERLASVWWEGMSRRYPSPAEPVDDPRASEAFMQNFPD